MFENRNLRFDLFTLLLLAVTVLLTVALGTYHPADPPSSLVHPPPAEYQNACGPIGAYITHFMFESIGLGAYYLVLSLGVLAFTLLWRKGIDQPVLRAIGWVASLVAICALATMALPDTTPGPVIGAGGYLGAMGQALLESNFASTGAYILIITVLLAGVLLCTDYLLLKFAAFTTVLSGRGLMTLGHMGHAPVRRRAARPETDLEDEFEEDEEEDKDEEYEYEEEDEAEEDEEDVYEYEDEDEDEVAEVSTAPQLKVRTPGIKQETAPDPPRLKNKLASMLSIKKPQEKSEKNSEREEIINQLEAADSRQTDCDFDYEMPPLDLLLESDDVSYEEHEREVRKKARILEKTFQNFGFNVKVVEIETGPVIAQYEIALEAGLRLAKITNLADDLAIALRVPSVRIVAPIPGKNTVGIEVPNENRQLVRIRDVIEETNGRAKRMKIPIYLGKDVSGKPLVVDLAALPHLLIAGRTGTGKSVCLNSIIVSILMSRGPAEVRMLMIDPKMVELSGYGKLPHLMHPVVTDMKKAEAILAWAVDKMEERYQLLARAGVRHVSVYNQLSEEELRERVRPRSEAEWETIPRQLPFIVIVADEMADLMMTAGKDVEQHIIRLAQKSRAVGIHLILATQKPTVDVITGLIKSNLPARIAFQVASRTDSRVVLDENGADKLLGNGDMLFLSPGTSQLMRGQGTFLSDDEINSVVDFVGTDSPQFAKELIELKTKDEEEAAAPGPLKNRDELYEAAVDVVVREGRGSVSLLQRCLGIGYGRAARLIDYMAEDSIVGEYNGSQAREVLITIADWEAMTGDGAEESANDGPVTAATVSAKPSRSNRIIPGTDEPSDLEEESSATPPWEEDQDAQTDSDEEWEEDTCSDNEIAADEELSETEGEPEDEEWEYEDDESDAAAEASEEELAADEEWEYEDDEEGESSSADDELAEEGEEEYEDDKLEEDDEWEEEDEYADSV